MTDMIRKHEAGDDGRCRICNSNLPRPDVTCIARWPDDAPVPEASKGRVVASDDFATIFARMTEIRREREQAEANQASVLMVRDFLILGCLP